jgi:hypothetical protein
MKKNIALFIFAIFAIGWFYPFSFVDNSFLTRDNYPTPILCNVLKEISYPCPSNLGELDSLFQNNLLRNGERWQTQPRFEEKRDRLLSHFEAAGFISERNPTYRHYDYVIILGATAGRMRKRVTHFLRILKIHKIEFGEIIFLSGERPLDPEVEPNDLWWNISDIPKTESQAAEIIWSQVALEEGVSLSPKFLSTPMIQDPETLITRRPGTSDTIRTWLSTNPKQGRVLLISNQPYCDYQLEVAKQVIREQGQWKEPLEIDTVGEKESGRTSVAVLLDTLARYIHARKAISDLMSKQ